MEAYRIDRSGSVDPIVLRSTISSPRRMTQPDVSGGGRSFP